MTEFDPVEFGRSMGAMIREAIEPLKSENAELRKEIEALKARDPDGIEAQAVEIDVSDVVKELLASNSASVTGQGAPLRPRGGSCR